MATGDSVRLRDAGWGQICLSWDTDGDTFLRRSAHRRRRNEAAPAQRAFRSRVEGESLRGADGFRRFLDSFRESWKELEGSIEQITSIDHERVLLVGMAVGVGRRGGVPFEQRFAIITTVRDGQVTRTEIYSSPEEAYEQAGMRG